MRCSTISIIQSLSAPPDTETRMFLYCSKTD
nr:MAG TPA: hypothetical protein [Caudoviricetes sp.]